MTYITKRAFTFGALMLALSTPVRAEMAEGDHKIGALVLSHPFAHATLPNSPVAGGFVTITNTGNVPDRLVAARSGVAGRIEIHEMAMQGDVMRMRELPDGLVIEAGETAQLQPGGYHLMFMKLNQPLVDGDSVDVTLTFETAGEITLPLDIRKRMRGGMAHGKTGSN